LIELFIVIQLRGYQAGADAGMAFVVLALLALVMLAKIGLYIIMVAIIVQVVLSWAGPYSPMTPLLNSLTRPFLRVVQKRLPPVGNVDLSPLFVVVVIQLLLMLPVAYLEAAISQLLR